MRSLKRICWYNYATILFIFNSNSIFLFVFYAYEKEFSHLLWLLFIYVTSNIFIFFQIKVIDFREDKLILSYLLNEWLSLSFLKTKNLEWTDVKKIVVNAYSFNSDGSNYIRVYLRNRSKYRPYNIILNHDYEEVINFFKTKNVKLIVK